MTRLTGSQIEGLEAELGAYDSEMCRKTGSSLSQIAARAAGSSVEGLRRALQSEIAAVIGVTAGKGIIKGFVSAVAGIIEYMGCPCITTAHSDVAGLADGIEKGAGIVFMADDNRFVAVRLHEGRVVDNSMASAWGYATALDILVGGLNGKDVLLIGAGKVGKKAIAALCHLGAEVGVFDIDTKKAGESAAAFGIRLEIDLMDALHRYTHFFDASPSPSFILPEHFKPETGVAACGIPLGLSGRALHQFKERLIHDPLQLGTATMLAMAVCTEFSNKTGGGSEGSHRP